MTSITIPNQWEPRSYQRPLWNQFGYGKQYQRASLIWHRRAGKDSTVLNLTAREMFKRVGTYWHLFPEQTQARRAIWNGVDKAGRRIIDQFLPPEVRVRKSDQEMLIETANKSMWQMAGSDNYDSLVGSNPVGVVFSEWPLANSAAWDYIRPILLENNGWACFIGTPRGRNHGYSTHMMALSSDEWYAQTLTYKDTGVLTEADIQKERDSGMSESKIAQEYMCSFEADASDQFINTVNVEKARTREAYSEVNDPMIIGVDVARFGDDKTVIYPRRGRDARSIPYIKLDQFDTMQVAARVAEEIQRHAADACYIDEGGVGAGVVDRLRQLGFSNCIGVNFGSRSDRDGVIATKCANKRAEMWAFMREWFEGEVAIPDDNLLAFELMSPLYKFDVNNAVLLEKKEDMKKRGVPSPDVADALALTFAYPVMGRSIERQQEQYEDDNYHPIWSAA